MFYKIRDLLQKLSEMEVFFFYLLYFGLCPL